MDLSGKTIVITGASRGLGRELVKLCAGKGARVLAAARNQEELSVLAKETGCLPVVTDVTDEKQIIRLAEKASKTYETIDIWINNAGLWLPHGPVQRLDTTRLSKLFAVNVFGLIYGSKAALSRMEKQHSGIIVNILSTSALEGRQLSSAYCASKFAADGFTKSLQAEIAHTGITVIGVYPGGMKTHLFDEKRPEEYEKFMESQEIATQIVENIQSDNPQIRQILRRKE